MIFLQWVQNTTIVISELYLYVVCFFLTVSGLGGPPAKKHKGESSSSPSSSSRSSSSSSSSSPSLSSPAYASSSSSSPGSSPFHYDPDASAYSPSVAAPSHSASPAVVASSASSFVGFSALTGETSSSSFTSSFASSFASSSPSSPKHTPAPATYARRSPSSSPEPYASTFAGFAALTGDTSASSVATSPSTAVPSYAASLYNPRVEVPAVVLAAPAVADHFTAPTSPVHDSPETLAPPRPSSRTEEERRFELKYGRVIDHFELLGKELGSGSFGSVILGKCTLTDEEVAIKVIESGDAHIKKLVKQEIEILEAVAKNRVKNFVDYIKEAEHQEMHCLVFEKLDISLYDYVLKTNKRPFRLHVVRFITEQILEGLMGLAGLHYMHTDLKLENIMLVDSSDDSFQIKIIDVGAGRRFSDGDVTHGRIQTRHIR